MRILTLVPLALLLFLSSVGGQEKQPPPREPPELWLASAAQQDGTIVVQIAHQYYVEPRKVVARESMRWENWRPVTLGETVRVFAANGKALEPTAVLKELAKPK